MSHPEYTIPKDHIISPTTVLSGTAVLLGFLTLVLYLWHEKDHDHSDYTVPIMIVALLVLSITATLLAVFRNLKDANRAKSLHAQIVTIKDDFRAESEGSSRLHEEEVRRLEVSHAAELSRAVAIRDQIKAERRKALDKVSDLEGRLALISSPPTSREVEQLRPLSPKELRDQLLKIAGDLCALLIGRGEELDPPYADDGYAGLGPLPPDDPEIKAAFVSMFGTRISDTKAHLGDRGLLGEKFNFSIIGDDLDSSSVRNADGVRKIIKCLDFAAKIIDGKFIRGISFPLASGVTPETAITPAKDEAFELIWNLKEFHKSLLPCPSSVTGLPDLTAENADAYASQVCTSIGAWSDQIRHGYAERFAAPVNELIHKLGSKGLDVRALEEYSKSVETDENVSNVIEALLDAASGLEGR